MNTLGSLLLFAVLLHGGAPQKPLLVITKDGYPAGHSSPEGAACDLARAFINCDAELFRSTCLTSFGGGVNGKKYQSFLNQTAAAIKAQKKKSPQSRQGPKSIEKVYAVRRLSKGGPESYAQATLNFKSVRFVDVVVQLRSGDLTSIRTMVLQDATGKWLVHPIPSLSPILSMGLNEEPDSKIEIGAAYTLTQKRPGA